MLKVFTLACCKVEMQIPQKKKVSHQLEPVGEKQTYNNFTGGRDRIRCPTEVRNAYIYLIDLKSLHSPGQAPDFCEMWNQDKRMSKLFHSKCDKSVDFFFFYLCESTNDHKQLSGSESVHTLL